MSTWYNSVVDHSYLVNRALQQVIEDENNEKDMQQSLEKCQKKVWKHFKS